MPTMMQQQYSSPSSSQIHHAHQQHASMQQLQPKISFAINNNPSSQQAISNALTFLNRQISDGPTISLNQGGGSTPEMIHDDNSDTFIQHESDSDSMINNSKKAGLSQAPIKHTNFSIIKKKSIQDMNNIKQINSSSAPAQNIYLGSSVINQNVSRQNNDIGSLHQQTSQKKNKGSFVVTDNNHELENMIRDNQNYLTVKKVSSMDPAQILVENDGKSMFQEYGRVKNQMMRQPSANRPHDTVLATNFNKLGKINYSGGGGDSVLGITTNSFQNAVQNVEIRSSPHHMPVGSPVIFIPQERSIQKKQVELKFNQIYNSQSVNNKGSMASNGGGGPSAVFDRQSPKFQNGSGQIGFIFNAAQTPTNASKQQFQSPKILSTKSASQSDLRSGVKANETSKKKRAQDVRELSVKRSILGQDQQKIPQKFQNYMITTGTVNLANIQSDNVSPKNVSKRIGSFDVNNQQQKNNKNKILLNQMNLKNVKNNMVKKTSNAQQSQQQQNKEKYQQNIFEQMDEKCNINSDQLQPLKLRNSTFQSNPQKFRPNNQDKPNSNNVSNNNNVTGGGNGSKNVSSTQIQDISESMPKLESSTSKRDENIQLSLLNKFKNFFKKNTIQELNNNNGNYGAGSKVMPIEIQQIENNMTAHIMLSNMNNGNDIYTDLFSPIMEEKILNKETETIEEDTNSYVKINRAEYFTGDPSSQAQFQCQCARQDGINYGCSRALVWLKLLNKSQQVDIKRMKELYNNLISCSELKDYEDQIDKDLARTFPKCEQFIQNTGQMQLKRVLLAFSRYDPSLGIQIINDNFIGYVQGMNFIVGSMLYHSNEEVAFWIFVTLIEQFELRDIFEPGLPGLYKHCFVIERLIQFQIPDLFLHFQEHKILVEMYASDWIFCLFSNIIPIQLIGDFYDIFFAEGWIYFYKFCLSMLGYFKDKLLEEDEFAGILSHIKFKTPEKNMDTDHLNFTYNQKSPQATTKVFIFDEQTNSFTKQNLSNNQQQQENLQTKSGSGQKQPPTSSRLERMFAFLTKRQEGVWSRIFGLCYQWQGINEDQIKTIIQSYQIKQKELKEKEKQDKLQQQLERKYKELEKTPESKKSKNDLGQQ